MSFQIKYFSGALIIFSTLELCILWQIQYWVLVKYIHLWFELWDFAMESACGHDPVEDNVFSSRISLNHPMEFFFCQFVPLCNSCYHPIIMLVSECNGAKLSPMKAFPTPALVGFCLRISLPFRPSPCGTSSLPGACEQGPFCLSLCFCVVVVGITQPCPSLTLVWTCQLLSWCLSNPLRVISSTFLQCHCENCHLHLKCYEWRPFTFLPLTMYLKYCRVRKLFN